METPWRRGGWVRSVHRCTGISYFAGRRQGVARNLRRRAVPPWRRQCGASLAGTGVCRRFPL